MSEHYFTADPTVHFSRAALTVDAWGNELEMQSGSGVFSHGRLDLGTGVLLRTAEQWGVPPAGSHLDLGCGYGAIGLAVAAAQPEAHVVGVDVNERAVRLANENAERLGLADRFTAHTPDAVPEAGFVRIWSNPPIRVGKQALHDLLVQWLLRLEDDGRAVLVVGRNLGADSLARWLEQQGHPTTRAASAKGFRVLVVEPRKGIR